ncbi:MAG: amidohydrolase family protein [Burkholderiaceae bacterium]|nr:amidohydrolase family protein [Burkholderiaceae bacterium]MDO9090755.1 amidohydrolase family protein [Burkholderiaceae bacterium]
MKVEEQISEEPNPENLWRLETPGHAGWKRTARAGDPNKYFILSADCHANEPFDLWEKRIDAKYRDRLPRVVVDEAGQQWRKVEGYRPDKLRVTTFTGEDKLRSKAGADPEQRLRDHQRDGIDVELIFPNKGLAMWATPDPVFSNAMCRIWNDWAWETFAPYKDTMITVASLAPGDLEGTLAEVRRVAKMGFKALTLPTKPIWGPANIDELNYNLPEFDPLWAEIQEAGLPITFHIGTGRDPRSARGHGGAVINMTAHTLVQCLEPVSTLCSSGVLERFPGLKFATVEAGIGWIPWMIEAMDEAYLKHHMWTRPKLKNLPSELFRRQGFATFQEDSSGLDLAESHNLVDNFMWANDYPHHEGTWPHSAQAIERTMGGLKEESRAKILGLNAARFLNIDVPSLQTVY